MPEIDTDLFQVLALALLFLTLLVMLAALSALNAIKKGIESGGGLRGASTTSAQASPASAYQAPASAYEPASSYTAPQERLAQEVSTGFVSMTDAAPATTATTPAVASTSTALRGDEPEEQPFERDGRWWFKRGGELLVYEEGTGQWVASPAGGGAAPDPATSSFGATTAVAPAHADTGEGWKCSSCGAVNGSTATSCRMCFAPR